MNGFFLENYNIFKDGRIVNKNTDKILKHDINYDGYHRVCLWKNNMSKKYLVHRLVAQKFIPNPFNKPEVNHIDGNKSNNDVSNLEWVTTKENAIHAYHILKGKNYLRNQKNKLAVRMWKANEIYDFFSMRQCATFLLKELNRKVNKENISSVVGMISGVCNGNRKTIYGFNCEYL